MKMETLSLIKFVENLMYYNIYNPDNVLNY